MPKISKLGIPFKRNTPEYQREWRKLNPKKGKEYAEKYAEKQKHTARKRRYGITQEQYENMLTKQNYCCAICSTDTVGRNHTAFHVDHNHDTGKVRGLLCDKCNRGLGYFNDNPKFLKKASEYLNENN
jgi:lysine/ornithine N-monooxygenase